MYFLGFERGHFRLFLITSLLANDCLHPLDVPSCEAEERYRSISGVCNNIRHPEWGASNQELNRILPADYEVIK